MRCYQEIGLLPEARKFLDDNTIRIPGAKCPKCGEVLSMVPHCKEYDFQEMFYEDGAHLYEYYLEDGRIAREIVQAAPWSSGPMAFFCLEILDIDGSKERMFEWDEEEFSKY